MGLEPDTVDRARPRTIGATIPASEGPATSVVVFQGPNGSAMRNRSPRAQRPWVRAIIVFVQVSSMKITCSGSSSS